MPRKSEWFATWFDTEYYHLLYNNRDFTEAETFIAQLFSRGILRKDCYVLDLACGKGRHSRNMANLGARVLGIDLSANSIKVARQATSENLSFEVHDMRQPFLHGPFDVVVNLFTSFGYFSSEEENLKVLCNIHSALKQDGRFLLDFLNLPEVIKHFKPTHYQQRGRVHFDLHKRIEEGMIIKEITVTDGSKRLMFEERLQAFSPIELIYMLRSTGFEILEHFGDYQLNDYHPQSHRSLFYCKKI